MSITPLFQNLKTVFIYKRKGTVINADPFSLFAVKFVNQIFLAKEIETAVFDTNFGI